MLVGARVPSNPPTDFPRIVPCITTRFTSTNREAPMYLGVDANDAIQTKSLSLRETRQSELYLIWCHPCRPSRVEVATVGNANANGIPSLGHRVEAVALVTTSANGMRQNGVYPIRCCLFRLNWIEVVMKNASGIPYLEGLECVGLRLVRSQWARSRSVVPHNRIHLFLFLETYNTRSNTKSEIQCRRV